MAKKKKQAHATIFVPPVVTILGHVDHGKTTLLDSIRKTNVALREAGGITQRIGAYQISLPNTITFIDTPGHEAFAKMRSRGVNAADVAILVISASDGIMPQTKESLKYIKEAKIPYIIAATKIDLKEANLEKLKQQLTKEKVVLEEYGGEVPFIPLSSKTGQGIDKLLEMILLLNELQERKADPKGPFQAVVIESGLHRAKGPVATLIVKNGTINKGEKIVTSGGEEANVRAMFDEYGKELTTASVSRPLELLGLKNVVNVGTIIYKNGETVITQTPSTSIEIPPKAGLLSEVVVGEIAPLKLKIILKTDNVGSLEAITTSLAGKENVETIAVSSGNITESEVLMAKSSGAIIIGFNVKPSSSVVKLAQSEKVMIKTYEIIYKMFEEIEDVAEALRTGGLEEVLGEAKILAIFDMKGESIAGIRVISGRIARGDKIKIKRGNQEIGRAKIKSLKHQKEDITKAEQGIEAGAVLSSKLDFLVNDSIIAIG